MPIEQYRIAAVRRFNRFYTLQIGVLRKTFLDSPYSLGEARALYEMADNKSPTATDIACSLDLDAGYLSRLLHNFQKRGLIEKRTSPRDARLSPLRLSARGRKSFAPFEARSQRAAVTMLERLTPADRARLVAAMVTIENLLGASDEKVAERTYSLREPFEGACTQIVADFVNKYDAARERCWIAELDGENAGTVMLVNDGGAVACLRLLLVEPKARGLGIGARLTDEAVRFARAVGYHKITLWTHSVLTACSTFMKKPASSSPALRSIKVGASRS